MAVEFREDSDGEIDEVIVTDAHVHIEKMDRAQVWIGIDPAGSTNRINVNIGIEEGAWYLNVEEEGTGRSYSTTVPCK